jgi:hypothetical protein
VIAPSVLLGLTVYPTGTKAEAMASQTIVDTTTVEGNERALANEVEVTAEGGALLIQWSLSYVAFDATVGTERGRRSQVMLDLVAGLLRDDEMLAKWHLDYGTARQESDSPAVVQVKGTASGALVDQAPAGRHRYRVEVWYDQRGAPGARRSISILSRTMIVGPP